MNFIVVNRLVFQLFLQLIQLVLRFERIQFTDNSHVTSLQTTSKEAHALVAIDKVENLLDLLKNIVRTNDPERVSGTTVPIDLLTHW